MVPAGKIPTVQGRVITHHSSITIRRAAGDVAGYVLDPTTMPHWSAVIYEVEPPSADVFRPGGRLRGRMHILGVTVAVEGEMVSFDPAGRRAGIVVRPADVDSPRTPLLEHELHVDDVGDASVLHFRNSLSLPGWIPPELVSDELVRHLLDLTSTFALANIRYILEQGVESNIRGFAELVRVEL